MTGAMLKLLVFSCCAWLGWANAPLTTSLEGILKFSDNSPFNLTTRITLNHDEYTTYSRNDGSFVIYNVKPGIHQIDVHSRTFHFGQVKVQVLEEAIDSPPKCLEYAYPGATKNPIPYPLVMTAHATYDYFETRQGFSIFVIFKNPMFLMMAFSVVMMFMMPKMMEGLDPEEKARLQQQMEMQKDPTKMLSQLWGDGDQDIAPSKGKKKKT